MARNISLYLNLEAVNPLIFHKIKFTGNIYLMDKNYSENKKYKGADAIILNEGWLVLYDEYYEKTDDTRFKKELKNKKQTLELLISINTIEKIIEILEFIDKDKDYVPGEIYLKTVSKLGNELKRINRNIKFEVSKPIKEQLGQFKNVLGGLQSRYEILFKEDMVVEEYDIQLYYDIKAEIELKLDRNMPEYMNMLQWISYEKQYKRQIKREQNQMARKK